MGPNPNFNSGNSSGVTENDTTAPWNFQTKPKLEILYNGTFYDVTDFVDRHPGGNVIKFYTEQGEDATIPIQQFHYRALPRVSAIMKSFPKRQATSEELEKSTSKSEIERHASLTKDFLELHKTLESEGYFTPSLPHVILRWMEIFLWYTAAIYFNLISWSWTSALLIGFGSARSGMLHHEAAHYSMTGNSRVDKFLGSLVMGLFSGMSTSWWKSQHNRHHAMPQRLKHDVDLETMPFIAFNKQIVRDEKDGHTFFIQNQKYLFATLDSLLVIMYWTLWLHPRYALKKGQYWDLSFTALRVYLLFFVLNVSLLQYWVGVWISSTYLLVIFSMNHSHLDVTSEKLHWVEYCLVHTVDVSSNWAVDIFMSFLNYQIEHHLFPTMPQFRQRYIKDRVKALADKHNLPYRTLGFWEAMGTVFQNLGQVSNELNQ